MGWRCEKVRDAVGVAVRSHHGQLDVIRGSQLLFYQSINLVSQMIYFYLPSLRCGLWLLVARSSGAEPPETTWTPTTGLSGFVESVHVIRSQRCLCGVTCAHVWRGAARRGAARRVSLGVESNGQARFRWKRRPRFCAWSMAVLAAAIAEVEAAAAGGHSGHLCGLCVRRGRGRNVMGHLAGHMCPRLSLRACPHACASPMFAQEALQACM